MLDFETNVKISGVDEGDGWIRAISSEDRTSRARRFLEHQLRLIQPGQSLPSIHTIRQECGIGLNQVQALLKEFEDCGWVERRSRSGVFKTEVFKPADIVSAVDVVACARIDSMQGSPFFSELIHVMGELVIDKYQRELNLKQVWANQDLRSYERLATDSKMRAVVLAGSPLKGISETFSRHNIAVIELLPIYPVSSICTVPTVIAPRNVVSVQLEHLFSLGHTKIAYLEELDSRAPSWQMMCRREEFYRTMAGRGCQVNSSMVFYPGTNDTQICKSLEQNFADKELPTAFIIYDRHLNGFYKWAEMNNLRIGKDVSLVSTNDMPQASQMSPSVTSLRISRNKIAELSLDALEKVLHGEDKPSLIELPTELIVRDSTGPVPK